MFAYRKTLQQWTRERITLGWAVVQQSMADALALLGGLEVDSRRSEQALKIYRDSLSEWEKDQVLPRSLAIQKSIGDTLSMLGQLQQDQARWKEAADTYQQMLDKLPEDYPALDRIAIQVSLGDALAELGEKQADPIRFKEAASAYRSALAANMQQPDERAKTLMKIGSVLGRAALLRDDSAAPKEALAAYEDALIASGHDRYQILWAETQLRMADLLLLSGSWNRAIARFEEGVDTGLSVLRTSTYQEGPSNLDAEEVRIMSEKGYITGLTLSLFGELERTDLLKEAVSSLDRSVKTKGSIPLYHWWRRVMLGEALVGLGRLSGSVPSLQQGVEELRPASALTQTEDSQGRWDVRECGDVP